MKRCKLENQSYSLLLQNQDALASVLQFLDCCKIDVFHLKLCNKNWNQLINTIVPLHHLIDVLRRLNHIDKIPSLQIPTHFRLDFCTRIKLKKALSINYKRHCSDYTQFTREPNYFYFDTEFMLIKFILHYHTHPISLDILTLLDIKQPILQALAEADFFKNSSAVMKSISTITQLKFEHVVNETDFSDIDWSLTYHPKFLHVYLTGIFSSFSKRLVNFSNRNNILAFAMQNYGMFKDLKQTPEWQIFKDDPQIQLALLKNIYTQQALCADSPSSSRKEFVEELCNEFSFSNWMDKQKIIAALQVNVRVFKLLNNSWRTNIQFLIELLQQEIIPHPSDIPWNKEIVIAAVQHRYIHKTQFLDLFIYAIIYELSADKDLYTTLLHADFHIIRFVPNSFDIDTEWLVEALRKDASILSHKVSSKYYANIISIIVSSNPYYYLKRNRDAISWMTLKLRYNPTLMTNAIDRNGLTITQTDFQWKHMNFIVRAVKQNYNCLEEIHKPFIYNTSKVKKLITKANPCCYIHIPSCMKSNEELAYLAMKGSPFVFTKIPPHIRYSRAILQLLLQWLQVDTMVNVGDFMFKYSSMVKDWMDVDDENVDEDEK